MRNAVETVAAATTNAMLSVYLAVMPRFDLRIGNRFRWDTTVGGLFIQLPWSGRRMVGVYWCGWGNGWNAYDRPGHFQMFG